MGIKGRKLVAILILIFSSIQVFGQGEGRIHEVQKKETLYGIARQYNFTIDDLIYFNPDLKTQELKEGMKLVIPSDKKIAEIKAERIRARQDSSKYIYHKVIKGETQFALTQRYNVGVRELRKLNPILEEQGAIRVGQIIRVPRNPEAHKGFQNDMAALDTGTYKKDANWFYHRVQSKETAYSLSKRYNISLDSLYLLNPGANEGLRLGQWIKLPLNRKDLRPLIMDVEFGEVPGKGRKARKERERIDEIKNRVDTSYIEGDISNSDYFLYKVKKGDTFFSLKQRFDANQEELLALNKELRKGLVVGKYIVVPKKNGSRELTWLDKILKEREAEERRKEIAENYRREQNKPKEVKEEKPKEDTTLVDINKTYRVAMVLPFRSKMYADTMGLRDFNPHRDTEMASQYYFGFLMAADSVKAMGMDLRLKVYDSHANQRLVKYIAASIDSMEADLVVGPAYGRIVEDMADQLAAKDIPVISPLGAGVDVNNRPNLIQVIPPANSRFVQIANLINDHYAEANVIFAHCGTEKEVQQVRLIKSRLNPREGTEFMTSIVNCEDLQSRWTLRDRLAQIKGQKLVVLLGDDPVFLSDIVSKLYVIRDTSIHVVGSPRLLNYPTMELSYLNALNYHTCEFRNVNYQDSSTQEFIKEFRARFNVEPGPFAFQAYDAGLYFLPKLWRYGYRFKEHLKAEEKGSTGYEFEGIPNGGIENTHLFINQLLDYQAVRRTKKEEAPRMVEIEKN
ncbi:MAG: LysM peptidoglycan-binding domain-containing protein [Bacteroidetes bacterium]|nr:LysM peptidoglycan-binding domain-containing protein [Bacteroidota bacterium]